MNCPCGNEEFRTLDDYMIQCCHCSAICRQLKRIAVAPSTLVTLVSGIYRVASDPELTDALVANVIYEPESDCFMLYLWSPTFTPIPIGTIIPEVPSPVIERLEVVENNQPGFVLGVMPMESEVGEPMLQLGLAMKANRLEAAEKMPDRRSAIALVASELGLLCRDAAPQVLDAYLRLSEPREQIYHD